MKLLFLLLVIFVCVTVSVAKMKKKTKKITGQNEKINRGMAVINIKLNSVDTKDTNKLITGINSLSKRISTMMGKITGLKNGIASLNTIWNKKNNKLITGMETMKHSINKGMNIIRGKITGLHTEMSGLKKGMASLNTMRGKLTGLQTEMNGLKKGMASLNTIWNKKTNKLITGMETMKNSLNKGMNTVRGKITKLHTKTNVVHNLLKSVNGGFTAWKGGKCTKPCGGGQKHFTRTCTNPAPMYGGKKCVGKTKRTEGCNMKPCLDCADICRKGVYPSGVYIISPDGITKFHVYCDMKTAGGGWTVFQKRIDGSQNFYLNWHDYKTGFGSVQKEYWVGNDRLNVLTHMSGRKQRLRVDLWDNEGNTRHADYGTFLVANEVNKYKLTVGSYSGNAGDSLKYHNGRYFTTKDRDNDSSGGENCAISYKGAWWFKNCHHSNLNGRYLNGKSSSGINWWHWKHNAYSYPHAEMKIRPTYFNGCKK